MKKIISILFATMVIGLLSSCILVVPEHTLCFYNDTNDYVYDWYVINMDGDKYAASTGYCEVAPGEYDYISNLKEDCYMIGICVHRTKYEDIYIYTQNYIQINSDTTFYYSDMEGYTTRSNNAISPETTYVLKDSKGNVYKLVRD